MTERVDIEFLENFVLAEDFAERKGILEKLTPYSLEWYYFSILNEQLQSPQSETAEEKKLMTEFQSKHGRHNSELKALSLRRSFLAYETSSDKQKESIIKMLREDILHISYAHSKPSVGLHARSTAQTNIPSKLNQSAVDFSAQASSHKDDYNFISSLTPEGKLLVSSYDFKKEKLQNFINSMPYPSFPNCLDLVVSLLNSNYPFRSIDLDLTKTQLEQLRSRIPTVVSDASFISKYIKKLQGAGDVDWTTDIPAQDAFYSELWTFAKDLPQSAQSYKVTLLYHCLVHEWTTHRTVDEDHFQYFIQIPLMLDDIYLLPKPTNQKGSLGNHYHHYEPKYYSKLFSEPQFIRFEPHGIDANDILDNNMEIHQFLHEVLVQHLATEKDTSKYDSYLNPDFLRQTFIEAKLLSNDLESVKAIALDEDFPLIEEVTRRVELEFLSNNTVTYPTDDVKDTVALNNGGASSQSSENSSSSTDNIPHIEVLVKNIKQLNLQLYEINTYAFYTTTYESIDASVELDGLVASYNLSYDFSDIPSSKRHIECLPLPLLSGRRGVFIAVITGDGKTMRAIIRKGEIRLVSRPLIDGIALTLLNERNEIIPRARACVWVDGRKIDSSVTPENHPSLEAHELLLPYSTSSSTQKKVVLQDLGSGFCSLCRFTHLKESYDFSCGIYVDREDLIRHNTAHILLRPQLRCNNMPASVSEIKNISVTLTSLDVEGIPSSKVVEDISFNDADLPVIEYDVPENLANLSVSVTGTVTVFSDLGRKISVSAEKSFSINKIDATKEVVSTALRRDPKSGYVLCVFGKSGEIVPNHVCTFTFNWRQFLPGKYAVSSVQLQTDENGEIALGMLNDIQTFDVTFANGNGNNTSTQNYGVDDYANMPSDSSDSIPSSYLGIEGSPLRIPFTSQFPTDDFKLLSLLSVTSAGYILDDCTNLLSLDKTTGEIIVSDKLASGQYTLFNWKSNKTIQIHILSHPKPSSVQPSPQSSSIIPGKLTVGQTESDSAVQIVSAQQEANGSISVTLANCSETTRLHLFASHFIGVFYPDILLRGFLPNPPSIVTFTPPRSFYTAAVALSSEHQYISQRKRMPAKVGNLLEQPSLLLNPTLNK